MKVFKVLILSLVLGTTLIGCSSNRDINYVAEKYEAEVVSNRIDSKEVYSISKNETVMLEDPTTKEKIEISNAVVIKTICDYDSAKQWMEKCNISFVSDEGKGIRGIDQFVFDNREYTYLIYSKNNIDNEDINNKVKYLVIEDMENDKNYVLEVPNQEGIMIYLK